MVQKLEVTDPKILEQLNQGQRQEVTDPKILEQLNAPEDKRSYIDKAGDWIERNINKPIGRPVGAFATGIVQGVENAAASVGNLALMPFTDKRIPYYDPSDLAQSPTERMLMSGGKIAGEMIPVVKGSNLLTQGMRAPSLLKNVLASGATGVAFGGSEENDLQSRLAAGLAGGALTGLTGLSSKAISNRIKPMYERVFGEVEKSGLADKPIVRFKQKPVIDKELPSRAKKVLTKFLENPTYKGGHLAQSDIGKITRELESKFAKGAKKGAPALDIDIQQYNKLNNLRDELKDYMSNYLERYGKEGISQSYKEANKRFAKEHALREFLAPKIKTGAKVAGAGLAAKQVLPYQLQDYGQDFLASLL